MKFKSLLILLPLFALSACGGNHETGLSTSQPTSNGQTSSPTTSSPSSDDSAKISAAFKEMGEEVAYIAASKQRAMIDVSDTDKMMQLATPSGIVYVVGKLYENNGFDCMNKVVEFREVYDMDSGDGSTPAVADITLSLMIDVDVANNKAMLYAYELIDFTQESMHMVSDAKMFLDFDFDFATNTLGDFKMWNKADVTYPGSETPSTGFNYAQRIGDEIKKLDLATQDDEYNTIMSQIEGFITLFDSKAATKTVADATTARVYGSSFIAGQNYINQIVNSSGSIDFHNK